jgi:hypothetical protein
LVGLRNRAAGTVPAFGERAGQGWDHPSMKEGDPKAALSLDGSLYSINLHRADDSVNRPAA